MTKNEQYWQDTQDALTRVVDSLDINSSQYDDLLCDVRNIRGFINKHEPKKGKWLTPYGSYSYRPTTYKCSLCGCETDNRSNYCPSCGAYMKEVSE